MNLPKGTEVLSATVTRAILANQVPRYAFGTMVGKVTDAFNTGMSWIGDKAGQAKDAAFDVFSYLSNPTELLATMLEKFGIEVPKIDGALGNLAAGAFSSVKDHALTYIKGLVPKMSESLGASFSGSGSTMAKTAISQALAMLNKPMSLLGPLMTIAQKSPVSTRTRSTTGTSTLSEVTRRSMFQIINSTFQRWKMPGYNNRRNPLDSALAAIRYMDGRYGGIMNHPGIVNMMRGGGYLPYANGGIITRPHMGLVGEAGPEAIIPLSEDKRGVATGLLRRVASVFGMEVGTKRGDMRGIVDYVSGKANASSTSSQQSVQFVYSPVIHFGGDVSRNEMDDALKMSYEDFTVMMERFMRDRQRKAF
ncbi:MAG: transglycosylase SLT domain-containing protein [Paracoccaceae bacterium]|nr:MAG: transglycosylase SLT domain-containing protein [Paracoccaceae bacterium]